MQHKKIAVGKNYKRLHPMLVIVILSSLGAVLIATPYYFQGLTIPRVEEFYFSIIPLLIWSQKSLVTNKQHWNSELGLGTPWPSPQIMNDSPLGFFIGHMPIFTALGLFVFFQIILQATFVWLICKEMKLSKGISYFIILSVILAPPIEYLITSDALGVYFDWTLIPAIFYSTFKFVKTENCQSRIIWTSALALISFYTFANGHLGVLVSYLVIIPVVVLMSSQKLILKIRDLVMISIILLVTNIATIHQYLREYKLYSPSTMRIQYDYDKSLGFSLWSAFLKPMVIFNPLERSWSESLYIIAQQNSVTRVFSLGSPIVMFVIVLGILQKFKTKIEIWPKNRVNLNRTLWGVIFLCMVLQFLPAKFFGDTISATWTFKDPAIFSILIIFGYYLQNLQFKRKKVLISLHLATIAASALALSVGPSIHNRITGNNHGIQITKLNALAQRSDNSYVHKILRQNSTCLNVSCVIEPARLTYTSGALDSLFKSELVNHFLLPNSLAYWGLNEVSAVLKGVSFDSIYPSQQKFYGMIAQEGFQKFGYIASKQDWVRTNAQLRNFLGIKFIIAKKSEKMNMTGLQKIGTFEGIGNPKEGLVIYKNSSAKPKVFLIKKLANSENGSQKKCGHQRYFMCMDISKIYIYESYPRYNAMKDGIHIQVRPSPEIQNLIVTEMWRPEWQISKGKIVNFNGIMKIIVPSNTETMTLRYVDKFGNLAIIISYSTILLAIMILFFSRLLSFRIFRKNEQSQGVIV